jgi:hypothetical protein
LQALAERDEPLWRASSLPAAERRLYWIERGFEGFNVFYDGRRFLGLRTEEGIYDPARKRAYHPLLRARSAHRMRQLIRYFNRLPKSFWGKFWAEPLYKLPLRLYKKMGRELTRLVDA